MGGLYKGLSKADCGHQVILMVPVDAQDVKLRNAFCLCHVLRMHAPDTPYSPKVLEVSCTPTSAVALESIPIAVTQGTGVLCSYVNLRGQSLCI